MPLTDFESFIEKVGMFIVTFAKVLIIAVAAMVLYRIVNYFLRSAALARIGRRRHIKAWGLAWVPVAHFYVLGAIADDHDKKNTGHKTGLRFFLPLTLVFAWLCRKGAKWIAGAWLKDTAEAVKKGIEALRAYLATLNREAFPVCFTLSVIGLFALTVFFVYKFICMYKLVESCRPKRVLWVMLIYMLIPFAKPFVLIFVSGGDAHPAMTAASPAQEETAEEPCVEAVASQTDAETDADRTEERIGTEPAVEAMDITETPVALETAAEQTDETENDAGVPTEETAGSDEAFVPGQQE